jgi:predicted ATPase
MERLEGEPHTRLRYFCSPQHTDSALFPVIGQMERAAGLAHGDTTQVKHDKLDALLAQTSTSKQDAALFAEMLSLSNDGRYPALNMDPQQRRQKTLEALTAHMEALSRQNPLLMIFEDAHWTDPTSLETFGRVVDRARSFPLLLIVTFRPDLDPPWIGRSYVTALTINRLAQHDIEAMIDRVVGNKLVPPGIRKDIIERTDGVPLFVEEMTKAVLEAGSEQEAQRTAANVPSTAFAVPASLHASLMARLDRLGAAREVAQIGAAIGREFSHALLAAVISKPEADLGSALERLIDAGLLFRQGVPPHVTYLSSTPSYRMRLTGRCCGSNDARFMLALPKLSKAGSRRSPRPSPKSWRGILPRPGEQNAQSSSGSKRGGVLPGVRLTWRLSYISSKDWGCWLCCLIGRVVVMSKSTYNLRREDGEASQQL